MTDGQASIKIDKTNLLKAGKVPVIAAAVGGALWLLGARGGLLNILFLVIAIFAGFWYADQVLKSGVKPPIAEVIINGAILGAVTGLVYAVASWITFSIRFPGIAGLAYRWGVGSLLRLVLEGAVGGVIGAAGWYAYKTGLIKTK